MSQNAIQPGDTGVASEGLDRVARAALARLVPRAALRLDWRSFAGAAIRTAWCRRPSCPEQCSSGSGPNHPARAATQ
eukprot:7976291-Alexandrium_andersonii.AAC.1